MTVIVKSLGFAPEKIPTVMKLATLLPGLLLALSSITASAQGAAHGVAAAKPDLAKGEATSNSVCAACHTNDGSRGSPANPILQGQHPEYMVKQLSEFKADKRQNPVMKGFASQLSEQDMTNVAALYGSKQAKPGFAKNKDLVTLGQKIWRGGIADRRIAACAGCHGPNGAGIPRSTAPGRPACRLHRGPAPRPQRRAQNSLQMTGVTLEMTDHETSAVADASRACAVPLIPPLRPVLHRPFLYRPRGTALLPNEHASPSSGMPEGLPPCRSWLSTSS
jgi:cytochrome c553